VLELLTSLVDRSLVQVDNQVAEAVRYRLLETLRQYARERLANSGEAEAVRRRHADFYLAQAGAHHQKVGDLPPMALVRWLDVEHDNLRAALRYFADQGKTDEGEQLARRMLALWVRRGFLCEGRERVEALLAAPRAAAPTEVRAGLLYCLGLIAWLQRDYTAAIRANGEARSIWQELGDDTRVARAVHQQGHVAFDVGDLAAARNHFAVALAIWQATGGSSFAIADSLRALGDVAYQEHEYAESRGLFERSLALLREMGSLEQAARVGHQLGQVLLDQGEAAAAGRLFEASLVTLAGQEDRTFVLPVLEAISELWASQGQPERALRLASAAAALRTRVGTPPSDRERECHGQRLAAARLALDPQRQAAAAAQGRAMTLEQAVAYALADAPDATEQTAAPV
jgi:tetratricopeptide (TPR) repeat protein